MADSSCAEGIDDTIIAVTILLAGLTVSTTSMLTDKRTFEGFAKAHHAPGRAIDVANWAMQRCGRSPVITGVPTTQ